jgi:virulence-associated protein VapD
MLAIAFDLTVSEVERLHPRSISAAYADIGRIMARYGYEWRQGSVYIGGDNDLGTLIRVVDDLRKLAWFPASVRDIRAFRVEQWSDLTPLVKA